MSTMKLTIELEQTVEYTRLDDGIRIDQVRVSGVDILPSLSRSVIDLLEEQVELHEAGI